ncbi:MAG: hypothetical protein V1860_02550 [bacterium]
MQSLVIHSNRIFFEDTLEERVPDFYEWLSRERGATAEFMELDSRYKNEKEKNPSLLREIYKLALFGLSKDELLAYCGKYNEFYFNKNVYARLRELKEIMEILILSSYPAELYEHLVSEGAADKIFGAQGRFDSNGHIFDLKEVELKYADNVLIKMKQLGFGFEFTLSPNVYGLLETLIDFMVERGLRENDITLVGKNMISLPLQKVSFRHLDNLP